jgi:hypothetical protein
MGNIFLPSGMHILPGLPLVSDVVAGNLATNPNTSQVVCWDTKYLLNSLEVFGQFYCNFLIAVCSNSGPQALGWPTTQYEGRCLSLLCICFRRDNTTCLFVGLHKAIDRVNLLIYFFLWALLVSPLVCLSSGQSQRLLIMSDSRRHRALFTCTREAHSIAIHTNEGCEHQHRAAQPVNNKCAAFDAGLWIQWGLCLTMREGFVVFIGVPTAIAAAT